ncbi:MAG TPA: GTP cyclohydrolase I FolE, partial [Bacteroidetes bacterium]|nr:GTP cyclohydrolase I FolE [Bacteroidota bacterium]
QNAVITTSAMRGVFKTNRATRDEFVELIQQI